MCIVTGRHMVKEDWCTCPRSRMPALLSHYENYLQYEQVTDVLVTMRCCSSSLHTGTSRKSDTRLWRLLSSCHIAQGERDDSLKGPADGTLQERRR